MATTTNDTIRVPVRLAFISMLGYDCTIDGQTDGSRILVDADTLVRMADAIVESGIAGEDGGESAQAIRLTPRDKATGLFDVTEFGGGYDNWMDGDDGSVRQAIADAEGARLAFQSALDEAIGLTESVRDAVGNGDIGHIWGNVEAMREVVEHLRAAEAIVYADSVR
jgi:hypothetical protein